MKTILKTDRLSRPAARIPPRWPDDFSPPTTSRSDVRTAQPAASVPRNSARRPAPSEEAVWRQIWRLHNKERARYENPLISANASLTARRSPDDVASVYRALRCCCTGVICDDELPAGPRISRDCATELYVPEAPLLPVSRPAGRTLTESSARADGSLPAAGSSWMSGPWDPTFDSQTLATKRDSRSHPPANRGRAEGSLRRPLDSYLSWRSLPAGGHLGFRGARLKLPDLLLEAVEVAAGFFERVAAELFQERRGERDRHHGFADNSGSWHDGDVGALVGGC